MKAFPARPDEGLYRGDFEHDACGVAFVVDMHGRKSRDIVEKAITALVNLEHRGAAGAEPNTGDGAGILIQIPDAFFRAVVDFELPPEGSYATGIAFLPQGSADANAAVEGVDEIVGELGLTVLGWRDVPIDDSPIGALARDAMPTFRQVFIGGASGDVAATLVAGVKAGTIGAKMDSDAEIHANLFEAGEAFTYEEITSEFTSGSGFVHLVGFLLRNAGA